MPITLPIRRSLRNRRLPPQRTATLDRLLRSPVQTPELAIAWRERFDELIDNPGAEAAVTLAALDEDGDASVTERDRDYWLDKLLRRYVSRTLDGRLPASFAATAPTTFGQSDPLDLAGSRTNSVVVIDPANTNAVYVGAVGAGNSNRVYNSAARSAAIGFIFGTSAGDASNTYNYGTKGAPSAVPFGDLDSLTEYGGSVGRRFVTDGSPATVYLRGGVYDWSYPDVGRIQKNVVAALDNESIVLRAYPGEDVVLMLGAFDTGSGYSTTVRWLLNRPNLRAERLICYGYRDIEGVGRVFAGVNGMLQADAVAAGFQMVRCQLRHFRGIDPAGPFAAAYPHYRDMAYANRAVGGNNTSIFGLTLDAPNSLIRNSLFEKSPDDFPDLTTPQGGEPLDLKPNAAGTIVRRNVFRGCAPHAQIRGVRAGGITIEDNDISNPDQACIIMGAGVGFEAANIIIRRNRVHDWATRTGAQGAGIQLSGVQDTDVYANAIWNPRFGQLVPNHLAVGLAITTDYAAEVDEIESGPNTNVHVWSNVLYKAGMNVGYQGGGGTPTGKFTNVLIEKNVNVGVPPGRDGSVRDTPFYMNMGGTQGQVEGVTIRNNVLGRPAEDPDPVVLIESLWVGSTQTVHKYAADAIAAALPTFTGNVRLDPGFQNAESGDLHMNNPLPFALEPTTVMSPFAAGTEA